MIKNIEGIIFDLDNTLILSEHVNVEAGKKTFRELGLPLTNDEAQIIPGKGSLDYVPIFMKKRGLPESEYRTIIARNRANYDKIWDAEIRLMPHARETLEILRTRGKRLAIATTNRKSVVEKFFKKFSLHSYFDCYASSEDVTKRKPDPEVYNVVKMRMGLPDNALVAVEDMEIGVRAVKGAGLVCVAIPSEYSRSEDFRMADFVLASLGELPDLVE
ncbi:MAG: hypothetical protein A2945_00355 [Candidatus Liptonbacteria bacterium RIFCSPLOWO2_01_FULL_52_25]|uniref:FCP1 homology domain-containing protein n=1 Tax=Candidatus Liptonbacteria bacterium RIFCSPLOWO2_01_FULL_52_25 TaxID=1798650 RepID=A0A1G2CFF9_9BACT|nr:MAG: hypothetical protein A2945_00355 [Candidatus Liptonbacteria bacterium RIFCSPLOWO2_01_FULL_52_25]